MTSDDMLPRRAVDNAGNGGPTHWISASERVDRFSIGPRSTKFGHLRIGVPGVSVAHSRRLVAGSIACPSLLVRHVASVLSLSAKEQVLGPHAGGGVAVMANGKSGRHFSVREYVSHSVSSQRAAAATAAIDAAIPPMVLRARPDPARISASDLWPEPLRQRFTGRHEPDCRTGALRKVNT
jgi:hypothetical protein